MFSVIERELVVVVFCFEIVFCHANIRVCESIIYSERVCLFDQLQNLSFTLIVLSEDGKKSFRLSHYIYIIHYYFACTATLV